MFSLCKVPGLRIKSAGDKIAASMVPTASINVTVRMVGNTVTEWTVPVFQVVAMADLDQDASLVRDYSVPCCSIYTEWRALYALC